MAIVTLITDFGLRDSYVAEMKGVMLSKQPRTQIVDVTHKVPVFDIQAAAWQLLRSYRYFPSGSWHLVVVDPGVGTARRAVYAHTPNHHFVGPDNGVLYWAVKDAEVREGVSASVHQIPTPKSHSATFHGRDVFAPFIAERLRGWRRRLPLADGLMGKPLPRPVTKGNCVEGEVIAVDGYGNVVTNVPVGLEQAQSAKLRQSAKLQQSAKTLEILAAPTYGAIKEGSVGLIAGSHGYWEFAVKQDSAATKLALRVGDGVNIFY